MDNKVDRAIDNMIKRIESDETPNKEAAQLAHVLKDMWEIKMQVETIKWGTEKTIAAAERNGNKTHDSVNKVMKQMRKLTGEDEPWRGSIEDDEE